MVMAWMQKWLIEETPLATSKQNRVPPPLPPHFEKLPVGHFVVPEEQLAEQFPVPVQSKLVGWFSTPLAVGHTPFYPQACLVVQ